MRTLLFIAASTSLSVLPAVAAGSGFDPRIIVLGEERQRLQQLPIERRPNRPLHFYGNSIRRRSTRSVSSPAPNRSTAVRSTGQSSGRRVSNSRR